jgi:hypothetical protein
MIVNIVAINAVLVWVSIFISQLLLEFDDDKTLATAPAVRACLLLSPVKKSHRPCRSMLAYISSNC